jgi:two-component system sensor histidine kinase KdpD
MRGSVITRREHAPLADRQNFWRERARFVAPLTIFSGSLGLSTLAQPLLGEGYASLIFVLGISAIGAISGLAMAIASAIAGDIAFNFFVAAPVFEVNFNRSTDFVPPVAFTICALISGVLSGRLKDRTQRVEANSERLENLLDASRDLQRASSPLDIYDTLESRALARLGIDFRLYAIAGDALVLVGHDLAGAVWREVAEMVRAGHHDYLRHGGLSGYLLSGSGPGGAVGVFVTDAPVGTAADDQFMRTLVGVIGLAFERAQLANRVVEVQLAARTEELKTSLLSSVSHDMRTPLTSICTSAASLLAFGEQFDQETSRQLLSGIVEECERLNHLTSNLLELTRLQSGPANLRPATLPVAEMIRSTVARLNAQPGGNRLRFVAPPREVLVEADTALFELALTNVIQNALLYSPPASPVQVDCVVAEQLCAISVTDSGKGIAPDQQVRVFERFYRIKSDHRTLKGTGLGLAIAKGFVEASYGTIDIVSPVEDGRGTKITIRLPVAGLEELP